MAGMLRQSARQITLERLAWRGQEFIDDCIAHRAVEHAVGLVAVNREPLSPLVAALFVAAKKMMAGQLSDLDGL